MSPPKTRAEALLNGAKTYFTGKACKHGHFSERYTQSATCAACIAVHNSAERRTFREVAAPAALPATGPSPEQLEALREWQHVKAQGEANARAHASDVAALADFAMWLCVARWPILPPETFRQSPRPSQVTGAIALYRFHVHPDDVVSFLAEDTRLRNARSGPARSQFQSLLDQKDAFERGLPVAPTPDEFNQADESWPEGDPR